MARPKDKSQLVAAITENYATLQATIEQFSSSQLDSEFVLEHRDRNVRDVIAHLLAWQEMFLKWYDEGKAGECPEMPAKGFTWRDTPALNNKIWKAGQKERRQTLQRKLDKTHQLLLAVVDAHSDEELFQKQHYSWTGSSSLGSYVISASSAHYHWAIKLLKRQLKALSTTR